MRHRRLTRHQLHPERLARRRGAHQRRGPVGQRCQSKSSSEIDDSGGQCSIDPTYPNCDQGDGQGFFNAIRTAHAGELVAWLESDPTGSGDEDVILLGDLNAYGMEDPTVRAAGYTDLTSADSYSQCLRRSVGYARLPVRIAEPDRIGTGAEDYHINADEPSVLDYNTNFKSERHIELLFAPDESAGRAVPDRRTEL